ncbi:MAG: carboxypeptidase M32, partial [Bacillota bacterium]
MEINKAKELLDSLERELFAYSYAMSSIGLDARTAAPPETQEGRGVALGILSARSHELMTSEELWTVVNTLYDNKEEAGPDYFRRSELLRKRLADSRA